MKIATRLRQAALAFALASFTLAAVTPALSQTLPSAIMPAHPKALIVESLRLPADAPATVIRLDTPDAAVVDDVKRANGRATQKRVQIGIGREVAAMAGASSDALRWVAVDDGWAARWSVTSAQAKALRIGLKAARTAPGLEIRFSGIGLAGTVYGPFTEGELAASAGSTYWSPVLEGETATVELFVPGGQAPRDVSISVAAVSHLLASPTDPKAESLLKIGESGFCEVNLICRSANDSALASAGEAVARMMFNEGSTTFLCTGTLLNSATGQFVPYFYTAAHCISDQATAGTLTTFWFYESTTCTPDTLNPNAVQVSGGAALLFADTSYDISFLRLNRSPPSGAVFAGWDASQIASGTSFTAIHHPAGDIKKVSLGSMGGYIVPSDLGRTVTFIKSNWNSISTGVTEGGSSGSGIFTQSNNGYAFRGGLLGGPSSCSASSSDLFDYYSRFDVAYQTVSQYLAASAPTNYTALWWASPTGSENGWGINIEQQGDIVFGTLFTYDQSGNPMWLVMSNGARQGSGDTFSGPLYLTTGSPFNQAFSGYNVTQVGTMTLSFSGASSGTLSYTVNGIAVSKSITKQLFGPTGAATCTGTTGSRAGATNYTDLWYYPSEAGWGINLTQQGNLMFATLFIYDASGHDYWLVMSAGQLQSDGSFTGALYQTKGNGAFNAQPWPGVTDQQVGNMTVRFSNGENGTLTYSVNGQTITKPITRQVFSTPQPLCN